MNRICMRMIRLLFCVVTFNSMVGMAQVAQFSDATSVMQQPVSPVMGYDPGRNLAVQQQANQVSMVVDAKQLRQWAETLGLGYKTANLMQLSKLLKQSSRKLPGDYQVQVPQFYGIAAKQTNNFLSKQGLVLGRSWNEIVERTVSKEAYDNHEVTPEFVKACEGLADAIEAKFNKAADVIAAQEKAQQNQSLWRWLGQSVWESESPLVTAGFDAATAKEIMALVKAVAKDKGFVTLRSTGLREDTTTIANAGGNESREIVRANLAETMRAMGAVASSYLRSKSLSQRSGKDEKIFELPELPVLLQRVVGEHEGGPVVSCVAYSQEREGNTEGVTVAQCAYGHGKTVVDSLFPVDTYYVDDKTGVQRTVIRLKTKRMAPRLGSTSFGLEEVAVEESQQKESALDSTAQRAIHAIMINLEHAYGQPMDVELVTDPAKKIVYLVQARPIVYEAQKVQPMYVADSVLFDKASTVSCKKIYETGAVYRLKPAAVLVTDNLESALKTVLDAEGKKQPDPQVIVVKEPGAITSHAGATLAGKGIALLQVDDTKRLNGILANKDAQLVVDTQRGLIADVTQDKRFAAQDEAALTKAGVLVAGRYSHPIPAVMTVNTKVIRKDLDNNIAHYVQVKDPMPTQPVQALVTMLKEAPYAQAREALEALLGRVAKEIDDLSQQRACKDVAAVCRQSMDSDLCKIQELLKGTCFKEKSAAEATEKMRAVFNAMLDLAGHVEQKLLSSSRSLDRLFMVNILEALLTQKEDPQLVATFSLASITERFNQRKTFIEQRLLPEIKASRMPLAILGNLQLLDVAQVGHAVAITPELKKAWLTFVGHLAQADSKSKAPAFIAMINELTNLNAFPVWINVLFSNAAQNSQQDVFATLYAEYKNAEPFLQTLKDIKNHVNNINVAAWADPKKFDALFADLQKNVLPYILSENFLGIFSAPGTLKKIAAYSFMGTFIDTFDNKFIKTFVSSTLYQLQEKKVQNFRKIVIAYASILKKWAPLATFTPTENKRYSDLSYFTFKSYIKMLEKGIAATSATDPQELIPPQKFNVADEIYINVIKSRGVNPGYTFEWEKHTLAAFFTLVHQNINTILANVAVNIGLDRFQRPPLLQSIESEILTLRTVWNPSLMPILIGVEFDVRSTTLTYDLPLKLHGVTYDVVYNQNDNAVKLIINLVNFRGTADAEKKLIEFTKTVSSFLGISILETTISEKDMKIVFNITASSKVEHLAKFLEGINDMTLNEYHPVQTFIKYVELNMPQASDLELAMIKQDLFTSSRDRDHVFGILEKYVANSSRCDAEIFKIVAEVLNSRHVSSYDVFNILSLYAAKPAYEAEVFKIVEELDDFGGEAFNMLYGYANKSTYVKRLWEMAVAGVERNKFNTFKREKWLHLQVLILWPKLSWYRKAYWNSRFLLGATDEQFIKAQL